MTSLKVTTAVASLQCRTSLRHCEAEGRGNLSDYAELAPGSRRMLRFARNDTRNLTRHYSGSKAQSLFALLLLYYNKMQKISVK